MTAEYEFRILGPLEVRRDTRPVPVHAAKHRVLLASLLLHAGRTVPYEELLYRLWGEDIPASARVTLRSYVMRLRRALDGGDGDSGNICTSPAGYTIDVPPDSLDLHRFERLLAAADKEAGADPAAEAAHLRRALGLWRPPVLANVPSDSLHRDIVPGLLERRLRAKERLLDLELARGAGPEVVAELRTLVNEEPLREHFWAQLMTALYQGGRQAEALDAFARVRALLREELGTEPGPELRETQRAVLNHTVPMARQPQPDEAPAPAQPLRPQQLPRPVSSLIGRDAATAELRALLTGDERDPGPVVVCGSPGVGKTALAVNTAHGIKSGFPDGQLYIDLRGHAPSPPLAVSTVLSRFLRALGVSGEQIPTDVDEQAVLYRSLLAERRVLVLLDNAASAEQVRPLLPGTTSSAVVVTSRSELRGLTLHGARTVVLDLLDPADSLDLLLGVVGERGPEALPRLGELAALCAGLPLALRVAAAILAGGYLDAAEFIERVKGGARLDELAIADDPRSAVRATFDLSYATLDAADKELFRLLGLVPGTDIDVGAVAALIGTTERVARRRLEHLAAAHLIQSHAPRRYRSHDLLREYAMGRAVSDSGPEELALARSRLFEHYLGRADAAGRHIPSSMVRMRAPQPAGAPFDGRDDALGWFDAEVDNIVAVIGECERSGPGETAWLLAESIRPYLHTRTRVSDAVESAEAGLRAARSHGDRAAEAFMLLGLGSAYYLANDFLRAIEHLDGALRLFDEAGSTEGRLASLNNLAAAHTWGGRVNRAIELFQRAQSVAAAADSAVATTPMLINLGAAYANCDLAKAHEHLLDVLQSLDPALVPRQVSMVRLNLAVVTEAKGELDSAMRHARLARNAATATGDNRRPLIDALIARIALESGRHTEAEEHADNALRQRASSGGTRMAEVDATVVLSGVYLDRDGARAAAFAAEALSVAQEIGYRWGEIEAYLACGRVDAAFSRFSGARASYESALALARSTGRRVQEGMALTRLALLHGDARDTMRAAALAEEALEVHRSVGAHAAEAATRTIVESLAASRG